MDLCASQIRKSAQEEFVPIMYRAERNVTLSVYKYPLKVKGQTVLELLLGATVLSFGFQPTRGAGSIDPNPVMWALVDIDEVAVRRRFFRLYATGRDIHVDENDGLRFIDTKYAEWCGEWWHLFEIL